MKALSVIVDVNRVPAYGLEMPDHNVLLNIPDDLTEIQVVVPEGATRVVYGGTGDLLVSRTPFALPAPGQVILDSPATVNFVPLFDVEFGQTLYLRTPVSTGVIASLSFYKMSVT